MKAIGFAHAAAVLIALTAFSGCSSTRTFYDYDREADFDSLHTFQWLETENGVVASDEPPSDLVKRRIRRAAEAELVAKGFESSGDPDFLVASHVGVQQRIDVRDWGYTYGMGYGRYGGAFGGSTDVREYDEGTLILDVIDAKSRNLIWRGTAKRVMSRNPTPEESEKAITSAVQKIIAKFPPKS